MMKSQKGFTIVELLIATTVFSVILLMISYGLINISKIYTKSVNQSRTQETARSVADLVAQAVQFGGASVQPVTNGSGDSGYCIGNKRFSYRINRQVENNAEGVLLFDQGADCTEAQNLSDISSLPFDGQELLAEGMFLKEFEVNPIGSGGLVQVVVHVMFLPTGEDPTSSDLLNGTQDSCSSNSGSEFCASSKLETIVEKRI